MFRTVFVRGLILALVLLVLGTPLAFAAGSREPEAPALRGVMSALWEALVELLPVFELDGTTGSGSGSGSGTGATTSGGGGDGGPHMDPNGKPTGP
jgi:hypothetical protein